MTDLEELTAISRLDLSGVVNEDTLAALVDGRFRRVLVLGECEDGQIRSSDSGLTVNEAINLMDKYLEHIKVLVTAYGDSRLKRYH